MADVFISYKKEDRRLAELVESALHREGITTWWDNSLHPRESWSSIIQQEIAEASAVVVLWTPRSVRSEWVEIEANYGKQQRKLVPLMVEFCDVPLAFSLTQSAQMMGWNGNTDDAEWRKAIGWILELKSLKRVPDPLPDARKAVPGRVQPTNSPSTQNDVPVNTGRKRYSLALIAGLLGAVILPVTFLAVLASTTDFFGKKPVGPGSDKQFYVDPPKPEKTPTALPSTPEPEDSGTDSTPEDRSNPQSQPSDDEPEQRSPVEREQSIKAEGELSGNSTQASDAERAREIEDLQIALRNLGYYEEEANGRIARPTVIAANRYAEEYDRDRVDLESAKISQLMAFRSAAEADAAKFRKLDDAAWENARSVDKVDVYAAYVCGFPRGKHVQMARNLLSHPMSGSPKVFCDELTANERDQTVRLFSGSWRLNENREGSCSTKMSINHDNGKLYLSDAEFSQTPLKIVSNDPPILVAPINSDRLELQGSLLYFYRKDDFLYCTMMR